MAKTTQIMWFDLETTGLDPETNGIVEIAAILQHPGRPGIPHKRFTELVDPRRGLSGGQEVEREVVIERKALEVNGIELADLDNYHSVDQALYELDSFVEPWCIPAGWNVAGFDIPFLKAAYKRAGLKWRFHYHCLDMMVVANWLKFCGKIDAESLSLQKMATHLGIDSSGFGDAHRAMPDVYTTLAIAKRFRDDHLGHTTIKF